MSAETRLQAENLLQRAFGPNALLREGQWEAVEPLLPGGARVLVVQRTGWGKSAVYFLATKLLRDRGAGPTLLVSPLLALMRNQVEMAAKFGLNAASLDSTNRDQWSTLEAAVRHRALDLLLISPERLANPRFRDTLLPQLLQEAGLMVIDEAHCISDWGHDFRPDYRRIVGLTRSLHPSASILATTATANDRVVADLREQLGSSLVVQRGTLARPSLRLSVFEIEDPAERLAWLSKYLRRFPGTGIVYVLTVDDAERVAQWLVAEGYHAASYHADLSHADRLEREDRFGRSSLKALVATTALGMGYDKEDVSFVIHFGSPGSPTAYYQQVGRAGRTLETAYGVLLYANLDAETHHHFMDSAMPPRWIFEKLMRMLRRGPRTLNELMDGMNTVLSHVLQALEILDAEAQVTRSETGWVLVPRAQPLNWARIEAVREARERELEQMQVYASLKGCRLEYLQRVLDDPTAKPCGRCDNCRPHAPTAIDREVLLRARALLYSQRYPIVPRKSLPKDVDVARPRKLASHEQLEPGLALSAYNAPGWGQLVRAGKYADHQFREDLIQAAVEAVRTSGLAPEWVTWVPSFRSGELVRDLADRIAAGLGIPVVECLFRIRRTEPQKTMQTSAAQFLNVWGSFVASGVRPGRCLLVDDIVDSGWTLTVAGLVLREAGATAVTPFALATARPRRG